MRKLLLPALAACSMLAVSAPVASAHKAHTASLGTKLADARGAIKGLKKTVKALFDNDAGQKASIHTVDGKVDALGATVQGILSGVPTIINALTAIQSALQDPTTGLVGLNNVRPQYGAFNADGTIIGGTGQTTGASGPKAGSIHNSTGTYIVDFGNDVSSRVFSVNPFPASTAPIGEAVDCASNATATATCNALNGGTLASPANHVLVTIEDHSGTQCVRNLSNTTPGSCNANGDFVGGTIQAANQPFSVVAIHG